MAENEQAAAALPTCVLIVEAEIDDDVADAWNTWYDTGICRKRWPVRGCCRAADIEPTG